MSNISMKTLPLILGSLLAVVPIAVYAGTATAEFADVSEFTDFSVNGMTEEKTLKIFERELADELEKISNKYLAEGETLVITFTDIDMAGDIQPWRNRTNSDIRYIESIYPPRLKFTYVLSDAGGEVLEEGDVSESDLGFQLNAASSVKGRHMSFFYELELLSDWARNSLKKKDAGSTGD